MFALRFAPLIVHPGLTECEKNDRLDCMAMVEKRVRFSEDEWSAVELGAERTGVSAAQFARIAAVAYAAFDIGRAGAGDPLSDAFAELFAAGARLAELYPL